MSRTSAILGVLLGVSLLLNVVSFRREPAGRGEAPRGVERRGAEAAGAGSTSDGTSAVALNAELERERKLTAELRDAVRRLEGDREVLAQAATAGAAAKSPTAGLREKLRRLKKIFKGAEDGVPPDPEAVLEMSGELMDVMKLGLARSKDPKTYADYLQAGTEIALEDEAALAPDQAAALSRIFQDMAEELGRIDAASAGERLIRELEIEGAALARVPSLLTAAQQEVLKGGNLDNLAGMASSMNTTWLQKSNGADTIVRTWTQAYQLQEAQLPAARAAAESFLRSLEGVDRGPGVAEANGGQAGYETRVAVLRAQMTAFKSLEGSLTTAQLDRLRTQTLREFRLMEVALPPEPPKK